MVSDKLKVVTGVMLVSLFLAYSLFLYYSTPLGQETKLSVPLAYEGKMLWQEKNCISCHQLYGLGGYLGPDLTNVYTLKGSAYIKAFLAKGTAVMPDFKLSANEMDKLVAFLKMTDASGKSDPRTFLIQFDGTISQK
jgi:nitric oxide reductase subunit C